jgi:hypothetical protein
MDLASETPLNLLSRGICGAGNLAHLGTTDILAPQVQTSNKENLLRHAAHAVPKNNLAVNCYSCDGTGCACQLEQFFIAFK